MHVIVPHLSLPALPLSLRSPPLPPFSPSIPLPPPRFSQVKLQADRVYKWCSCGTSRTQPFCDGKSHHLVMDGPDYQRPTRPKFRPTQFKVPETGEYWLCQCKQTSNRPFCDGSHRVIEEVLEIERPMLTDGKRVPVKLKK